MGERAWAVKVAVSNRNSFISFKKPTVRCCVLSTARSQRKDEAQVTKTHQEIKEI